ncbi:MAG: HlyD family efflux transporter periplasmic adaptor subunit [Eubacteriales bacterium]|nr:HlyD family efflux transporter periplasmic adaptor subunit [Eubacteriales bacterium]
MRRKKRVTGRFYIFLLILLVIAFLIVRPYLNFGSKSAVIMAAQSEFTQNMNCVIIRDEAVSTSESTAHIEYAATEGTLVNAGETVAYVYSAGYSESLLQKLEETRAKIQDYHKTEILNNIKDDTLARYDTIVDMMALEFKNLVNHDSQGSLLTAARQLETAMVNRQEYLRQNKREDVKLSKLYDEETTRLNNIQSWRKVENASQSGVISFYTDGYESVLSAENIASLSAADINTVLAGERLTTPSAKETAVYRIVNQDCWYVALVTDAKTWNPVVGQPYTLQMEGFEDLSFTAFVTSVQKESGSILAVFQINDPIGPLIYQRTGRAKLTATISGLSVSSKALSEENGQIGVWLIDVGGETFIPVEVLSSDGSNALIQPLVDGALGIGQAVRIK